MESPARIHDFLRAYFHFKSADWKQNQPFKLAGFTASELAKMPTYYIMDFGKGMAETVAEEMPSAHDVASCKWLTEDELDVYAREFGRTGFQGRRQWYRCAGGKYMAELEMFSGRTIDVPACFIAGKSDWGIYQFPGAFEKMQTVACTRWRGTTSGGWRGPLGTAGAAGGSQSRLLLQFCADKLLLWVSEPEITAGKKEVVFTGNVWLYNRETGDFTACRSCSGASPFASKGDRVVSGKNGNDGQTVKMTRTTISDISCVPPKT